MRRTALFLFLPLFLASCSGAPSPLPAPDQLGDREIRAEINSRLAFCREAAYRVPIVLEEPLLEYRRGKVRSHKDLSELLLSYRSGMVEVERKYREWLAAVETRRAAGG